MALAIVALAMLGGARSAAANDKLTVGKAFPTSFAFVPINVAVDSGINLRLVSGGVAAQNIRRVLLLGFQICRLV